MSRLVLASVLLCAWPGSLPAFGPLGHELVASLAEARLSDPARAEIRRLLGADRDLPSVSTWADELRDGDPERGRATARWHFVNIPREAGCRFDRKRDCPEGQCIVAALKRQARILADRAAPESARAEALKWVVHLVADIHQPLHAGYPEDRGGNLFQVHYLGRGSNLHALWDSGLFESRGLDAPAYLAELEARAAKMRAKAARWSDEAPQRWAEESCALIESLRLYPARPGKLPREYIPRLRPHAEERLILAGLRLAALLEATLVTEEGKNHRPRLSPRSRSGVSAREPSQPMGRRPAP
jgi:hypothetical protein